jgi:hypothetical protein
MRRSHDAFSLYRACEVMDLWMTKLPHSRTFGVLSTFSLDKSSELLPKRLPKETNNRPEMRRDGTTFVPRVRGPSENISRVGGAAGVNHERPKTMKEIKL